MGSESPAEMWRVAKHEGVGNVVLERVPIPDLAPDQVLVRTQVSLISRGSELWRRYVLEEAVDPGIMGYSTTGIVVRTGSAVTVVRPGDRVVASAPHAEYSITAAYDARGRPRLFPMPDALSFEAGTFHPLATSSAGWTAAAAITPDDDVVVLGQGIVGNLVMQFAGRHRPARLIAVDALPLRCRLSRESGAPEVVDASAEDPVAAVRRLTGGAGASIVVDCVGGQAGVESFSQAQNMVAPGGLIQVIGLYHGAPLPLDASKIQGKRIMGGYPPTASRDEMGRVAMSAVVAGEVQVEHLITHRFPGREARAAFDFLYQHPDQAMGVLLHWE